MGKDSWKKWVVGGILASCTGLFYWFFIRPRLQASSGSLKTKEVETNPMGAVFSVGFTTDVGKIAVYPEVNLTESHSFPVKWHIDVEVDGNKQSKDVNLNELGKHTEEIVFSVPEGYYTVKVFMTLDNPEGRHLEWSYESPIKYYVPSPSAPTTPPPEAKPPEEKPPEEYKAPPPTEQYTIVIQSEGINVPVKVVTSTGSLDGVTPVTFNAYPYTLVAFTVPKTYNGYNLAGVEGVEETIPQDDSVLCRFVVGGSRIVTLKYVKPTQKPKWTAELPLGKGYINVYDVVYDTKTSTMTVDVELVSLDPYNYAYVQITAMDEPGRGYVYGYTGIGRQTYSFKVEEWRFKYGVSFITCDRNRIPITPGALLIVKNEEIRRV